MKEIIRKMNLSIITCALVLVLNVTTTFAWAGLQNYSNVENFDVSKIEKTVEYLLSQNKVVFEFRTTVCSPLHEVEDIKKIAFWIKGAKHYYLQNFVDSGNLIGKNIAPLDKETLNQMLKAAQEFIPSAQIRGI